ncbi:Hydroxyethylthiazole kinase family-domain-containing protein [Cladorrhinum sp. PSN259]|nr:Hydroxyethylthiazole kinase family-domain-containing protein [Cladorrhinum sp. PSN259]
MRFISTVLAAASVVAAAPDGALESRQASTITVDLTKTYQKMDGFGFSLAFQRANLITNMSDKTKQRELLDLLFNRTSGAGFTIIRNGIGSTPNSNSDFMNTIAPNNPGGPKATPQYVWDEKDSGQLWVSQEAVKTYGVKQIYANAWSAPGYMKTNGRDTNGGNLCGVPGASCSSGDWRQAYADYLVAYIKFYAEAGVNITHLGFLNEPDYTASYASMQSNGNQAADFIKVLYPTLEAAGLSEQVGIACCESMGWGNNVNMINAIRSAGQEARLKAVTSHTYQGGPSGPMNSRNPVWFSEQCDLNGQWTTSWYSNGGAGEGLTWANNVYSAVVNYNASGYLYWEGVQWPNPNTNEKMIKVDNRTNTYEVSKRLWALANWSRYVRPGALRVGSSGGTGVRTAAFKNEDGTIAVIAISTSGSASNVNIKIAGGTTPAYVQAFVSDSTRNAASTAATLADDGTISGSVAARMGKPAVDYVLYLVTDSTPAILGNKSIFHVVEESLKGGVTIVQLREKKGDTGELITTAKKLLEITRKYNVPLLINDRIDVALAVGCEGVHIGQDDMELSTARKLLGPDAIIGVTVSNVAEALKACEGGADYLGIGTVYATPTKTNTKEIIGAAGVRHILEAIADARYTTQTVCIGGINETNLQRILYQSGAEKKKLDGVAVVSAIMAAPEPDTAARHLLGLVKSQPPFVHAGPEKGLEAVDCTGIISLVPAIIKKVHETTPLSHNMTNLVVQNFAANVALAAGASPIMANYGEEAPDLCKLGGSLVINMGTVTPEGLLNYYKALKAYNQIGRPVVFDPVGAGATAVRREAVRSILANGYLDIIKGNEGEIRTVFGNDEAIQQRGVDSTSTLDHLQKAKLVKSLALREKNVVVMTGKVDYVSDGKRTFLIENGHSYLGIVTGTGCTLGTAISAALAVHTKDKLAAAIAAILHFEIAAELAAVQPEVKGPGTFVPAFLDQLYAIRLATGNGDLSWLEKAKLLWCPT